MMKHKRLYCVMITSTLPLASCGQAESHSQGSTKPTISAESNSASAKSDRSPTLSKNLGTVEIQLVPDSMPLVSFWKIMEAPASVHESQIDKQEQLLAAELRKLLDEDLIAFKLTYDQVMDEAYSWDLWAAAYFAGGGCSDDGFTYFRNWLIGRGEHAFYNALNDPDSLEIFDLDGEFDIAMSCEWDLLPSIIWDERHPSGSNFYDQLPDRAYIKEPKGEPFDEDDIEGLKAKFPRLTKVVSEIWD